MQRRGRAIAQVDDAVSHDVRVLDIRNIDVGVLRIGEQRADDIEQLRVAGRYRMRVVAPVLVRVQIGARPGASVA